MARLSEGDRARLILEARKRQDPLQWYTPTPTQEAFHCSMVLYRMLQGGNRSGKSSSACADMAWTLRGNHPYRPNYKNLSLLCFTNTRLQAAQVVGKKLFRNSELHLKDAPKDAGQLPMIPAWEIEKLNEPNVAGMKVPYEIIMKNGNRMLFSWAGVDAIFKRIAGLKIDGVYVDEDAGTTTLFDELYPRLLDSQSDQSRPGLGFLVWSATNTSYNEAYDAFVDRCNRGVKDHALFAIGKNENPAIDESRRDALRDVLSEEAARIRVDGSESAGGLVQIYHKQWSDERHILKEPYKIDPSDNLWIGYDPGVDHPMGMVVVAINKEHPLKMTAVKSWIYRGDTIERDANELRDWLNGRQIAGFVYDTNLKNKDRGGGPSVLTRFKELLAARGINPLAGFYQSKKNHSPGIAMFRHYLDPNPDDRRVPTLFQMSPPDQENGLGQMRAQILAYRGKEATKFTGAGGVVKKNDEACLDGSTMILLADYSHKRIDQISPGDMVQTPIGPRRVTHAACTGVHETHEIRIGNVNLIGTGNHPVLTDRGFVPVDSVRYSDIIAACADTHQKILLNDMGNAGTRCVKRNVTTEIDSASCCTDISGKKKSALYQKAFISITRMATTRITTLRILSVCLHAIIASYINAISQRPLEKQPQNGTAQKKAMTSIAGLASVPLTFARNLIACVSSAVSRIPSYGTLVHGCVSALITANQRPAVAAAWTISASHALSVGQHSLSINTAACGLVPERVLGRCNLGLRPVFNITVEDAHCYIANGIVVSNCDCLRYLSMQRPSYNPQWACGRSLDIATQRVALLDANDNLRPHTVTMEVPQKPRFDFNARVFYSRSRDRRRGRSWQELPV